MMTDSVTDHNACIALLSGEKFRPVSSIEPRVAQVVERQVGDLEVRDSNPGSGSNFSLKT